MTVVCYLHAKIVRKSNERRSLNVLSEQPQCVSGNEALICEIDASDSNVSANVSNVHEPLSQHNTWMHALKYGEQIPARNNLWKLFFNCLDVIRCVRTTYRIMTPSFIRWTWTVRIPTTYTFFYNIVINSMFIKFNCERRKKIMPAPVLSMDLIWWHNDGQKHFNLPHFSELGWKFNLTIYSPRAISHLMEFNGEQRTKYKVLDIPFILI